MESVACPDIVPRSLGEGDPGLRRDGGGKIVLGRNGFIGEDGGERVIYPQKTAAIRCFLFDSVCFIGYSAGMEVIEHVVFGEWMRSIADMTLKLKVLAKLGQVKNGNLGDHKSLGGKISELRIHWGPGYRIYYTMRGPERW